MPDEFRLLNPGWLVALVPLALLLVGLARNGGGSGPWRRVIEPHLLAALTVGADGRPQRWPLAVLALGWLVAVIALANPTFERIEVPAFRDAAARVVVLDLSQSMLADDLAPNRLERARFKVEDILRRSRNGQVGLVVFAGDAFTVAPLTDDGETIRNMLPALSPEIMPAAGSRPGLGIQEGLKLLRQAGVRDGEVVVLTDDPGGARARSAAADLRRAGHRLAVIGVGTPEGAAVPGVRTSRGAVIAQLEEGKLRSLARHGGGDYARISVDDADLREALARDESGRVREDEDPMQADVWKELGPWVTLAVVPLAALGFRRGWLLLPAVLALNLGLVTPAPVLAQTSGGGPADPAASASAAPEPGLGERWRDLWQRPDQQAAGALAGGDYARAARLAQDPARSGAARYRLGDFDAAAEAFGAADDAQAHYNRGNALARAGRLEAALEAYDQALARAPDMADAAYNRERVQEALERREQQSQQQRSDQSQGQQQDQGRQGDAGEQSGEQSGGDDADAQAGEGGGGSAGDQQQGAAGSGGAGDSQRDAQSDARNDAQRDDTQGAGGDGSGADQERSAGGGADRDAAEGAESESRAGSSGMRRSHWSAARWRRIPGEPSTENPSMSATVKQPWLAAVAAALLLWSGGLWAEVSARFDRSTVHEGDTVNLIIETDGLRGGQPDLSALDADFEVLGTSTGSRIQIVNGRQSAMRTWKVQLAPKRQGSIEVPPMPVGDERTPALRLTVTETPREPAGVPGDDLFLEVDVGGDGGPVFVQQQVPLTVRLYSALPLRGGELSSPRPDGAVLERLGEDVQYSTRRNGRRYQVIERRFSLSPERSGELRIPPVSFSGDLRSADGGPFGDDRLAHLFRDPLFERFSSGFERGEPVRARSRAVTLEVEPQPDDFDGRWWLPARELAIDDSWERDPPALARGEPATRTLTITATGLAGSQIPEIAVPAPDSVRVYADDVEAETRTDGEKLFGVSRQQVTVMPTAGGSVTFPEIRVRWWDVQAGRERTAVVPARRLPVAGAAGGAASAGRDAPAAGSTASAAAGPADAGAGDGAAPADAPLPNRLAETRRPVGWLLLVAALLGGLALLWRLRHRLPRPRLPGALRPASGAAAPGLTGNGRRASAVRPGGGSAQVSALRAAAANGDARAAAQALLGLARRHWGASAPTSLGGIAARLAADGTAAGEQAGAAVRGLEASLYGPQAGAWDGSGFAEQVLPRFTSRAGGAAGEAGDEALAPLYPQRR
ncbi:BatD family protein [Thiohalocapsa halophila]|nr:BatD family protein [Thiohalocapsa halophila]